MPPDFEPELSGHSVPATLTHAMLRTQGVYPDRPALRSRRRGKLPVFQKRRTAACWRARTERPLSSSDSHTRTATHTDAYFMVRQECPVGADGWLCLHLSTAAEMLSLTVWAIAATVPYAAVVQSPTRKSSSARPSGMLNTFQGNGLSEHEHFLEWHGRSENTADA